ncbi:unnamed protein product [Protopolystoma xenopodis]|uniref:Uncharacterized protein n=1 Tax=Protopolystoma xenopodis TaxID=117903 RepID=A0A3S5FGC1_9PLAT|nr:unnamed protein product [Protopolystoma xenopodis]
MQQIKTSYAITAYCFKQSSPIFCHTILHRLPPHHPRLTLGLLLVLPFTIASHLQDDMNAQVKRVDFDLLSRQGANTCRPSSSSMFGGQHDNCSAVCLEEAERARPEPLRMQSYKYPEAGNEEIAARAVELGEKDTLDCELNELLNCKCKEHEIEQLLQAVPGLFLYQPHHKHHHQQQQQMLMSRHDFGLPQAPYLFPPCNQWLTPARCGATGFAASRLNQSHITNATSEGTTTDETGRQVVTSQSVPHTQQLFFFTSCFPPLSGQKCHHSNSQSPAKTVASNDRNISTISATLSTPSTTRTTATSLALITEVGSSSVAFSNTGQQAYLNASADKSSECRHWQSGLKIN